MLNLFDYYYEKIMNRFLTVDEGIAQYRRRTTELGVEEYLAELNKKLED